MKLALADVDVFIEMPVSSGFNMTAFLESFAAWQPPQNGSAVPNTTVGTPSTFFASFNVRVALSSLNSIMCVTGVDKSQCYTDLPAPNPTPTPTPTPTPINTPTSNPELSTPTIAAIAISATSALALIILITMFCIKRRSAPLTKLVMRCIIRETIDWPPKKKNSAQLQRAFPRIV